MIFIAAVEVFVFMLIVEGLRMRSADVGAWLYKPSAQYTALSQKLEELKRESESLQSERAKVSLQEEFAKYMKLDRKLISVAADVKKQEEQVAAHRAASLKRYASVVWWTSIVAYLVLIYFYKRTPIFYLPPSLLSPLADAMAYRSGAGPGAISGLVWIFVCRRIAAIVYHGL